MAEDQEIMRVLNFVRTTKVTSSEWRKNGKNASGHPDTWNQFRMSGPDGSITISLETQKAIRPLVRGTSTGPSMYELTEEGKKFASEYAEA